MINNNFYVNNTIINYKIKKLYLLNYKNILNFNKKKINLAIIDLNKLKTKLIILNKEKCILNLTPGIILKKLNIIEKNMKKNIKILNYMIKITFNNLKKYFYTYNYIINIIGVNTNFLKILKFLKKNLNIKKNIYLINLNRNKNIKKSKKVKSIKKNMKKKYTKI